MFECHDCFALWMTSFFGASFIHVLITIIIYNTYWQFKDLKVNKTSLTDMKYINFKVILKYILRWIYKQLFFSQSLIVISTILDQLVKYWSCSYTCMVVLRTFKKDNCMSFVQFLVNYMFICFHIHYVDKDRLVRHGREGWFVIYLFFL